MTDFIPGQRWINSAQLQMGLGTVLQTDFRTVTTIFLATGETFVYSKESVPLTRVRFAPGDHILTLDEVEMEVVSVSEEQGLLTYVGVDAEGVSHSVEESLLNNFIQLNRPTERLFNGQVDRDRWFDIRYETRRQRGRLLGSTLRGLSGGRISLIPHQLYIANEVANRYAPRVLLADEVGLGKTIEAGMVLHHQLVTERARRVLIVVPDSLVHQWLVEMRRRFNLMFSLFDEERVAALAYGDEEEELPTADTGNPYHSEQLVICSLKFLCSSPENYRHCLAGNWDLMVVDEAHHLTWSEEEPGFEYQLIEKLAQAVPGVLLLTATPEQLGKTGHFARLRLLDPDRFSGYEAFVEEESHYEPVAQAVDQLLQNRRLDPGSATALQRLLDGEDEKELLRQLQQGDANEAATAAAVDRLVGMLLDRHGTGRVLFRNTRDAVGGFPRRLVHDYPVPMPEAYAGTLQAVIGSGTLLSEPQLLLCPELLYQALNEEAGPRWTELDPRVAQLAELLKELRPQKVLVIAASADTALDLSESLKMRHGVESTVFHEGMSLVERDRASAWFADQVSGVRVMVCSEIGSEGRNFQFAHHLVLFDLPLNPDLLEQRIGRLDRIGQEQDIHVHVVYLEDSAQQVMVRWYREALNALAHTTPAGQQVFARVEDELIAALHDPTGAGTALIESSHALHEDMIESLRQGRDRLLELNSCRPAVAAEIRRRALDDDASSGLQGYMEGVFDCFGVDYEIHSENCYAVNAGTHMLMPFPHLPDEGMTVTYDRDTALHYEDVDFLSWDHPLVINAMDLVVSGEMGNTAVVAALIPEVKRGTLLLESIYVIESASTDAVQSERYLPPTLVRVLIDQTGKRHDSLGVIHASELPTERIRPEMAKRIVTMKETLLRKMVAASEKVAQHRMPAVLTQAHGRAEAQVNEEIARLESLRQVNPNVRQDEIDHFREVLDSLNRRIDEASLRLDALRVIVAT